MGIYDVESGKTAKLKKSYVVESGKLVKLKKAYVVENGKLAKLWSGVSPQYLITTSMGIVHLSEDAVNWEQVNVPLSKGCKCVYGNGTYVIVFDPYVTANTASNLQVATSKDGKTWTSRKIGTVTPIATGMYNIHFCNGQFIVTYSSFESGYKHHVYTSSDGMTWTKKGNCSFQIPSAVNDYANIVYGKYNNKWCYVIGNGSGIAYSTDLLTWTVVGNLFGATLRHIIATKDGTIFAISQETKLFKIITTSASSLLYVSNSSGNAVPSTLAYNDDEDEIGCLIGADYSGSTPNTKSFYETENRSNVAKKGTFLSSKLLQKQAFVYGEGRYVAISANGSSTDKVRCHYSLDGGTTWTEVELGTVSDTGVSYNSSGLIFAKGE